MIKAIELVIFDCDGVLVDSERLAVRLQVELGAELGRPLTAHGGPSPAERLEGPGTVVFDDTRRLPELLAAH